MATLSFNVPNAALALLDGWAQRHGYLDFHAYEVERIKDAARRARREQYELDAQTALAQPIPDVTVT